MRIGYLTTAVLTTAIVVCTNNHSTIAQGRFLEVGKDSVELPVLLDVTTIKGSQFDLLSKYVNLWVQTSMFAKCQQERLFITQITLFDKKGIVVSQDKNLKELTPLGPGAPGVRAMQLVCEKR